MGRSISLADELTVAAIAYGGSVEVMMPIADTTKRAVGSMSAPNVIALLLPSCA